VTRPSARSSRSCRSRTLWRRGRPALAVERLSRWPTAADMREALEQSRGSLGEPPSAAVLAHWLRRTNPARPRIEGDARCQKENLRPCGGGHPDLRAQERPDPPESAKRSVETTRPLSREGPGSSPRRRLGSFTILALSSVAGLVAIAGCPAGSRDSSAPHVPPQAQGSDGSLRRLLWPRGSPRSRARPDCAHRGRTSPRSRRGRPVNARDRTGKTAGPRVLRRRRAHAFVRRRRALRAPARPRNKRRPSSRRVRRADGPASAAELHPPFIRCALQSRLQKECLYS